MIAFTIQLQYNPYIMKSKYRIILDDLTTMIENNIYGIGDMLPTEMELAEQYGVSRSTVQRTLNILVDQGHIKRTAGKGTFVMENENPEQNGAAKNGHSGKQSVIMILPNHQAHVSLGYLRGAEAYLKPKGFAVTAYYSQNRDANVWDIVQRHQDTCDGYIIYPISSQNNPDVMARCHLASIPIVTIDKCIQDAACSAVSSNNYMGGYLAAEHLVQMKHDTFFFISNRSPSDSLKDRYAGFCDGLRNNGKLLNADHTFYFDTDEPRDIIRVLTDYLAKHQAALPAAAFCASDLVASQVYRAAYTLCIQIPDCLSIIGFDDLDIASVMCPPLTTIAQNFYEIGRQAAITLLRALESKNQFAAKLYLPAKLVQRESVADRSLIGH